MKYFLLVSFSLLIAFPSFTQEIWEVDNAHSNLRFEVGWEDFSVRTGEFKSFKGNITTTTLDDLSQAAIDFTVDASSVDVIAERLKTRVVSDKFLDVEKYPEISFISNSVTATSDSTYVSTGKLKIRNVELDQKANIWVKGYKETRKGNIFAIEVTVDVDREAFGLTWGTPRLANNIKLIGHLIYMIQEKEVKEEVKK